jgi:hypothetical protein
LQNSELRRDIFLHTSAGQNLPALWIVAECHG